MIISSNLFVLVLHKKHISRVIVSIWIFIIKKKQNPLKLKKQNLNCLKVSFSYKIRKMKGALSCKMQNLKKVEIFSSSFSSSFNSSFSSSFSSSFDCSFSSSFGSSFSSSSNLVKCCVVCWFLSHCLPFHHICTWLYGTWQ